MNTSEVLEKIKKLLRLGQSPNRHEAELAVQRAFELASRYQIDIESVSLEDDIRKIVSESFPSPSRLSFARKKILNLLKSFFNVNIVFQPRPRWCGVSSVTFLGKTVDIQIAKYVYDYLHTCCARSLKDFCRQQRRKPSKSTQENFIQGFIYGIAFKLRAAQAVLPHDQHGLVIKEGARREQAEAEMFSKAELRPVKAELKRRNERALVNGWHEGQKVEIRKPIEANAAGQLFLT